MRGQTWPAAAKIREWTVGIVAHSRGDTGAGGHYEFERAPGAKWAGSISVPPMAASDAVAFRAFLHSLRGRSGSFYFTVPSRFSGLGACPTRPGGKAVFYDCTKFSDGTPFSDTYTGTGGSGTIAGTTTANVAAGAAVIPVNDPTGLQVGDIIVVNSQLLRITGISGSDLTVRPRVRSAISSGATWVVGTVSALFRLASDAPVVPIVNGRSLELSLDIEEAY